MYWPDVAVMRCLLLAHHVDPGSARDCRYRRVTGRPCDIENSMMRSTRSRGVPDLPIGVHRGLRHHRGIAKAYGRVPESTPTGPCPLSIGCPQSRCALTSRPARHIHAPILQGHLASCRSTPASPAYGIRMQACDMPGDLTWRWFHLVDRTWAYARRVRMFLARWFHCISLVPIAGRWPQINFRRGGHFPGTKTSPRIYRLRGRHPPFKWRRMSRIAKGPLWDPLFKKTRACDG
jgi:hypothetical protein